MKRLIKSKLSTLVLIICSQIVSGQMNVLSLRPSVGYGTAFVSRKYLDFNEPNANFTFAHKENKNGESATTRVFDFFTLPQIGLILEYTRGRHTVGLGIGQGLISSSFQFHLPEYGVFGGSTSSGKISKTSLEYGYKVCHQLFKRINFYGNVSFSRVSNDHTEWDQPFIKKSADKNGITIDSTYSNQKAIQMNGWLASVGLRGSYHNKSGRERFSIAFSYDHGFTDLVYSEYNFYYNYLKYNIKGTQISRGNQIKVIASFPIKLYDFTRDRFNIFK